MRLNANSVSVCLLPALLPSYTQARAPLLNNSVNAHWANNRKHIESNQSNMQINNDQVHVFSTKTKRFTPEDNRSGKDATGHD